MSREIKFRGKRRDNGDWAYGGYCKHNKVSLCPIGITNEDISKNEVDLIIQDGFSDWGLPISMNAYEVFGETIGQYTGLKDKNEKEIYEGDIVEINNNKFLIQYEIGSFMLVRCSEKTDMYEQFKNCWNDDVYPISQLHWECDCEENIIHEIEVVGSVYENSELLEGYN